MIVTQTQTREWFVVRLLRAFTIDNTGITHFGENRVRKGIMYLTTFGFLRIAPIADLFIENNRWYRKLQSFMFIFMLRGYMTHIVQYCGLFYIAGELPIYKFGFQSDVVNETVNVLLFCTNCVLLSMAPSNSILRLIAAGILARPSLSIEEFNLFRLSSWVHIVVKAAWGLVKFMMNVMFLLKIMRYSRDYEFLIPFVVAYSPNHDSRDTMSYHEMVLAYTMFAIPYHFIPRA